MDDVVVRPFPYGRLPFRSLGLASPYHTCVHARTGTPILALWTVLLPELSGTCRCLFLSPSVSSYSSL
jgi:hypothetical protein